MAQRWPLLTYPYVFLILLIYFPIMFIIYEVVTIITLPYTFFYYSANWSILKRDKPMIQVYIDHFQSLYPELTSAIAAANRRLPRVVIQPNAVDFWPAEPGRWANLRRRRVKQYRLSEATALFIRLEGAGWSRRVLLTFLRDKVEQGKSVDAGEKEAFERVMKELCDHDLQSWLLNKLGDSLDFFVGWTSAELKNWDEEIEEKAPLGRPTIRVNVGSVDWILRGGAFLVPDNIRVSQHMKKLAKEIPLWQTVHNAVDLETGLGEYWQMMAGK